VPTAMEDAVSKALILMTRTLANAPKVDRELVEIWALLLGNAGLTPEEIQRAAGIVAVRETFFPQPVKFIEAIRPPGNEDAALEWGWQLALECVRDRGGYASITAADVGDDPRVLWAIERMGWVRLCAELADDNRSILRAEFIRLFRLAREQRQECQYVAGILELDNERHISLVGPVTPAMCGRPDWTALPPARERRPRKALPEGSLVKAGAVVGEMNGK
jgi:hypothetical protein